MKLTVVTPIYFDSYLAEAFVESLLKVSFGKFELDELIFVIDGGTKEDISKIKSLSEKHSIIKSLVFSRNFGQHIAMTAGFKHAKGDYVCMINVDQQDPPKEIPKLLDLISSDEDLDIVYGLRTDRKDPFLKRFNSKLFNFILNKLTGDDSPLNVATLRVMSRQYIDAYNQLTEKSRFIPGLESWIGLKKGYIPIENKKRIDNKSSYTFKKRINLALESIVSFSDLPLRWTAFLGMTLSILGFISLVVLTILKVFFIDFKSGYVSTVALIVLIGGIQIFVVGLAAIYIGRILKEVQNRPLYLIKEKINF